MPMQVFRVRANRGGLDEIVQAGDQNEAAEILFDVAEERRPPVEFVRVNRLQPTEDGPSGIVYEIHETTVVNISEVPENPIASDADKFKRIAPRAHAGN